jgi:hypothetical protein
VFECFIVAAIVFAAYAVSHPDAVSTLGRLYDDVVYLSVGKSIADGHGYRSAQLVGTPVHAKFPPLLPGIYAIGWSTLGTLRAVATLALWLNIVVTALGAGVLWWLARQELGIGPVLATPFVAVPIITERTMFYFSGAASEPWMLLGWAVALLLVRRLTRLAGTGRPATGTAVALGLALAATSLSRTQGAAIAVAVLSGAASSRVGWRAWGVAAIATVTPLLVWSAWHGRMMARGPLSPLPDQTSYLAWIPIGSPREFLGFATSVVRTSVPLYWSNTADVLVGWTSPKTLLLASALLLCGVVGIAMLARSFPAMAASLAITLIVLAIWPYVQDRFLTPVLPVLGVAGALAVQHVTDRFSPVLRRGALGGAALLAMALLLENGRLRTASVLGQPRSPFVHAIDAMVAWVDRATAPTDHVMVAWGGTIYLRTGRLTSIPNPEEPMLRPSVLDSPFRFYATRLLDDTVDDVIIWDRAPGREAAWLRALADRCPGVLTEVDASSAPSRDGVHFYRVRRDLPCLMQLADTDPAATKNRN